MHLLYVGTLDAPSIMIAENALNHVVISWNNLNDTVCGAVVYHLKLAPFSDEPSMTKSTMNLTHTFYGLNVDTYYIITVYGSNEAGDGKVANMTFKTGSKILANQVLF